MSRLRHHLKTSAASTLRAKSLPLTHFAVPLRYFNQIPPGYKVDANAEPLTKYRLGGYHPVHLGTRFKYGRYRVTHKLGWGGEGTVWLAHDVQTTHLVALKVLLADESGRNRESDLLRRLFRGSGSADHPGTDHLTQLLDNFWHNGPNGMHECLVLTVAGTNAQDHARNFAGGRLPALAAWSIARQTVLALDRLHTLGVAHGDLHTRNIMLSPSRHRYTHPSLLESLPRPYLADINALPPNELTQHLPKYIVEPTPLPHPSTNPGTWHAQLVDLGQSFQTAHPDRHPTRTPLVLRAPELLLSEHWDHRVDIWSLACTLFELATGLPPFDPVNADTNRLVQEWVDMFGDLPEHLKSPWGYTPQWGDDEEIGITECLRRAYLDNPDETAGTEPGFTHDDLECLGDLLGGMFRYRPEERLSTGDILAHAWFQRAPVALLDGFEMGATNKVVKLVERRL